MQAQSKLNSRGDYVLAPGNAAANRLRILHNIYGTTALVRVRRNAVCSLMRLDFSV
jgi:hypothetical protein